jgi:hypothetical protein
MTTSPVELHEESLSQFSICDGEIQDPGLNLLAQRFGHNKQIEFGMRYNNIMRLRLLRKLYFHIWQVGLPSLQGSVCCKARTPHSSTRVLDE